MVVQIYTLTNWTGGSIQSMMSSHLFFAVDPCFQIVKRIMINDLQMMEADTIPGHVVCMYYVVCMYNILYIYIYIYIHTRIYQPGN